MTRIRKGMWANRSMVIVHGDHCFVSLLALVYGQVRTGLSAQVACMFAMHAT